MATNDDGPGAEREVGDPRGRSVAVEPASAAPNRLRVEREDGALVLESALDRPRYVVGRAAHCDLCLPGRDMSREHAVLERDAEGGWWLSDRASASGTFVNGQRLEGRHRLAPGEVVRMSDYRFRFGPASELASASPPSSEVNRTPPPRLRIYAGPFANQEVRLDGGEVTIAASEGATVPLDPGRYEGVRVVIRPAEGGKFDVVDESAQASLQVNGKALRSYRLGGRAVMLRLGAVERVQHEAREGFQVRYLPAGQAAIAEAPLPLVGARLESVRAGGGAPLAETLSALKSDGKVRAPLGGFVDDTPTPVDGLMASRAAASVSVPPPPTPPPPIEPEVFEPEVFERETWPDLGQTAQTGVVENVPTRPAVPRLALRRGWRLVGAGLGAALLALGAAVVTLRPRTPPGAASLPTALGDVVPAASAAAPVQAEPAAKAQAGPVAPVQAEPAASAQAATAQAEPAGQAGQAGQAEPVATALAGSAAKALAAPALSAAPAASAAPRAKPHPSARSPEAETSAASSFGRPAPSDSDDDDDDVNPKKDEARRRRLICQQTGDCG